MNATVSEPRLEAPGAGLPKFELFAGRILFRKFCRKEDTESLNELIRREKEETVRLAESVDEKRGRTRVLLKRMRGMEDSSRFWSVFMTLEHVRMVNEGVALTLDCLSRGRIPDRKASTADVKPAPGIGPDVIGEFSVSCDQIIACIGGIGDPDRGETFDHPWFGPLGIGEWHALAAFHMRLHRKQVEEILRHLE